MGGLNPNPRQAFNEGFWCGLRLEGLGDERNEWFVYGYMAGRVLSATPKGFVRRSDSVWNGFLASRGEVLRPHEIIVPGEL